MKKLLFFTFISLSFTFYPNDQIPRSCTCLHLDVTNMDEAQLAKMKQEIKAAHDKVKKELKNSSILYSCSGAGMMTGLIGGTSFLLRNQVKLAIASALLCIVSGTLLFNKIKNLALNQLQEQEYERIIIALNAIQKDKA